MDAAVARSRLVSFRRTDAAQPPLERCGAERVGVAKLLEPDQPLLAHARRERHDTWEHLDAELRHQKWYAHHVHLEEQRVRMLRSEMLVSSNAPRDAGRGSCTV